MGVGVGVILLLVAGIAAIVLGFILPASLSEPDGKKLIEKKVHEAVGRSVEDAQVKIQQKIDDTIEESLLKTERGMDRITNEKMTAINEYADTVINDIHKNHDEVMFMYDMLNDKHKNLTNTVSEVTKTEKEARQTILDAELTARQAKEAVSRMGEAAQKINVESAGIAPPSAGSAAGYYDAVTPPLAFHNNAASAFFEKVPTEHVLSGIDRVQNFVNGKKDNPMPQKEKRSMDDLRESFSRSEAKTTDRQVQSDTSASAQEDHFSPLVNPEPIDQEDLDVQFARVFGKVEEASDEDDDISSNMPGMDAVRSIASMTEQNFSTGIYGANEKIVPITEGTNRQHIEASDMQEKDMQEEQTRQNNSILDMHEKGKSNIAIARELGLGVGEVGLVIELAQKNRRKRQG